MKTKYIIYKWVSHKQNVIKYVKNNTTIRMASVFAYLYFMWTKINALSICTGKRLAHW